MKSTQLIATLGLCLGYCASLPTARGSEIANPLFAYTHLLPSPYTLPSGRLVLGTSAGYGLTDFLQVGTNVLNDFYKIFNAQAKVSLLDYPEFAIGATLGYEHYNYHDISSSNPNLTVSSWQPGVVTSYAIGPQLALFVGETLNFTQTDLRTDGVKTSGYVTGARFESDLSWAYNPKKKSIGNVLSGGFSYDFSYKIAGFGVSHHWSGFHIGVHYYPNASEYKVQPILAGGASVDL